ncbi:helix-turn-helix transcriptional regulator [Mangrovibacter plantisponsor]|uniref:AraC family transcriptional regulator n=1 Tax=Mangrovibacter plantisponsor TaxID=451513 RepID=A0A317PWN1_9ENTR|nr:AraC family transcriptional regulator [Mangrovibacter plantisponsor]PWW07584.1 AraC family transcriptional regulator [Mangrovibacter plantisponsor]
MSTNDPLSDILQLLDARSYVTIGQRGGPAWSIRYNGFSGMKFINVRKGYLWFRLENEQRWKSLEPGDSVILTRFSPFIMATNPDIESIHFEDVHYEIIQGMAELGGNDNVILSGKMEVEKVTAGYLLDILPDVIFINHHSDSSSSLSWLMSTLHKEIQHQRPGSLLAGNHLMQLIMIESIRSWIISANAGLSGWMGALLDARIMRTLSAIHSDPARNWLLAELASLAGMSRTGFARLFIKLTGTTAIHYLIQWRMRVASKALRFSNESIKQIAYRVGYVSESAFSTVFKRTYGTSPSEHRISYRDGSSLNEPK